MSLLQQIEEDKKKLEEILKEEVVEKDDEEEEIQEKEPEKEEKAEEVKEEPKKDEKSEEDAKKEQNQEFARIRREEAAARKRADELERKNKELETKLKNPETAQEDPIDNEVQQEFAEIMRERHEEKAAREFSALEADFKRTVDDYDDLAQQYVRHLAQAIKVQNPRMSDMEVGMMTKKTILYKSAEYAKRGYNPIEELYQDARSLGFRKIEKQVEREEEVEEKPRPDMDKVRQNRERNSGFSGAKGSGGEGTVTRKQAADYTVAEWKALPIETRQRLLKGG